MRIRQILLIHHARSIRGLIKKYVYAELSDIDFREAENGQEALTEMLLQRFDMVLVPTALKDMTLGELARKMADSEHNRDTPVVVLSEDDNGSDTGELLRQGFAHVVMIRVRPGDLIRKIDQVCNPRQWRKDARYYIPGAEVAIYQPYGSQENEFHDQRIEGNLINISRGGVLLELVTFDPQLLMKSDLLVSVNVAEQPDLDSVYDLPCRLLRLNVTEWHPDNTPAAMRVTLAFGEMAAEKRSALAQLLVRALAEDPQKE